MLTLEIVPGRGVVPIRFGMSRADVRSALQDLGYPLCEERHSMDMFCEFAVQVEYFGAGGAGFVGVARHPEVRLLFKETDVYSIDAKQSFRLFASCEPGAHRFNRRDYCFPEQILTVWDADVQYDHAGGQKRLAWGQIGLGNPDYLAAIEAIRGGGA